MAQKRPLNYEAAQAISGLEVIEMGHRTTLPILLPASPITTLSSWSRQPMPNRLPPAARLRMPILDSIADPSFEA